MMKLLIEAPSLFRCEINGVVIFLLVLTNKASTLFSENENLSYDSPSCVFSCDAKQDRLRVHLMIQTVHFVSLDMPNVPSKNKVHSTLVFI